MVAPNTQNSTHQKTTPAPRHLPSAYPCPYPYTYTMTYLPLSIPLEHGLEILQALCWGVVAVLALLSRHALRLHLLLQEWGNDVCVGIWLRTCKSVYGPYAFLVNPPGLCHPCMRGRQRSSVWPAARTGRSSRTSGTPMFVCII